MIKHTTFEGLRLERLHPKLGEIITWEVYTKDRKLRLGVIRQYYDSYLTIRMGWRLFKVKYWLGSRFWEPVIYAGPTRANVLRTLWPQYMNKKENNGIITNS